MLHVIPSDEHAGRVKRLSASRGNIVDLLGPALVARPLCPGQEKHLMREIRKVGKGEIAVSRTWKRSASCMEVNGFRLAKKRMGGNLWLLLE